MRSPYTAGDTGRIRLDSQALGQPQRWSVNHRGLEYPGEVFFAESVDTAWGQPLQGDVCFRVVFYTVPRRIPAGQIRDPRIAMAVPRRAADPARETLNLEIRAIREAKESYVTGRGPDVQAVRSSMEEQEASLLGELARRESVSYAQGRIYTHTSTVMRPSEIFLEASVGSWVDRLVQGPLSAGLPQPPLRVQRVSRHSHRR